MTAGQEIGGGFGVAARAPAGRNDGGYGGGYVGTGDLRPPVQSGGYAPSPRVLLGQE